MSVHSLYDHPVEKVPMDPEDHRALLEWVRAKEEKRTIPGTVCNPSRY